MKLMSIAKFLQTAKDVVMQYELSHYTYLKEKITVFI